MRRMMKRGLAAGAVALAVGLPMGAWAGTVSAEDIPDSSDTQTWTPPRLQDCDAPDEIKAILESEEMLKLKAEHQAEAAQLRAERQSAQDPATREEHRAAMATIREENRNEVRTALADEKEALAWLEEHWAESGTQGGQGMGGGRGMGAGQGGMGMGYRAQQGAGAES